VAGNVRSHSLNDAYIAQFIRHFERRRAKRAILTRLMPAKIRKVTKSTALASKDAGLDFPVIASEWVREIRGKRSQAAFSRRLGYQSSVVHRWESGAAWPTAARFLQACAACGKDIPGAFEAFFLRRPSWLATHSATSREGVAAFLRQLKGKVKVVTLASSSGHSRYSVARWLAGEAEPKLPEFLSLIEATSRRALDFIATLSDPEHLPSARDEWHRRERLRQAAYAETWSHAVLRALELNDPPRGDALFAWLEDVLGIDRARIERALDVLERTGQVQRRHDDWVILPARAVTTGSHPATFGILTRAWTEVALERIPRSPSHSGYSIFAVSRKDLRRIRDLQVEYLREMQNIIAASTPNECVGLFCLHLLDLHAGDGNALASD
jgi:transcriptional regulator with XRE-family HTH domain